MAALFEAEPGTYVLTDFLVGNFRRTVLAELGLDRYPELWPDYFGHYRRVVWLAQSRDPALAAEAEAMAARFGLPLTVVDTGSGPPGTRAGASPGRLPRNPRGSPRPAGSPAAVAPVLGTGPARCGRVHLLPHCHPLPHRPRLAGQAAS